MQPRSKILPGESEERFRTFADNAPAKLWVTEPDASCSFLSSGWYEFTGQTEETGLGFGWLDAVHPDDRARSREIFLAANERHEPFSMEHRLRTAGGEYRWVIDAGRPRFGPGGEFHGYIGSVIDVHERALAEESLRINRERLDLVVNSGQFGLWYCDLPFDKLAWNTKVKEHFGLPPDHEVTIDTFYERLHPDDRERTRQAIEASIADRTDYDIEYRTLGLDGRERWIRAIGRSTYKDGSPVRFDGITVDITERVRQEEALKEADRRKDEFLATLAHELRNPLAPLRNGLEVLRMAQNPVQVEQARDMMERQLGHMVRLIDDLLDLSRISRGKVELRKERIDLAEVARQAVETSRPVIAEAGHELTVHLPYEPILVDADVTRLTQVFANLLNNAAKFTERGGHIALTVELRDGQGVASVRDNGVGIPAYQLPRVFDMFTQVDRSLERAQGGLGIGLSLVRGLVEMHGGSVEARSEGHGLGSEFIVRLPAVPLYKEEVSAGSAEPGRRTGRRRILVVDDNRDAATSLSMLLEILGHETRTAFDGLEALDVAQAFQPDLILLDIGMPRLNGYDTARRIREQPWGGNVALVALTGWGQEEDRRRSAEAGFNLHMVKPIEPAALERLLAGLQPARA